MDKRYYSLDVFRGATVALMILVNNPGSWSHIYAPLEHAPWHGCTPTDLVFPFFLFAVGNAMSFVMPTFEAKGTPFFLKKVLKRTVLIFMIGLLLNWSPFIKWSNDELVFKTWDNLRLLGVLQRIAFCYFMASFLVYFLKTRGAFVASAAILLGYWFLTLVFAHNAEPYSLEGFWGTQVDRFVLGENHMYKGEGVPFDPEGLISTLPAIVQVVFGYFVGQYIQQKGKNYEMLSQLFVAAIVLMLGGYIWDMSFPMNKKLWTSSYVLYTTGLAIATLGICIYWIEFQGKKGMLTRFFDVFGKNPLFIFVLSGLLPRLVGLIRIPNGFNIETGKPMYTSAFGWLYEYVCKPISADLRNGSLLYALILIGFYWAIVYWMDKKKIYVKV